MESMKKQSSISKTESQKAKGVAYRNAALPVEKRVKDLLSQMTLEEKAAQMLCIWQQKADTLIDSDGNFDLQKARKAFKKGHGIGQVGRPSDAGSTPADAKRGRNARQM